MAHRDDLNAARQNLADTDAEITGISEDVESLHAKILELENSPDRITADDQAILTEIVTMSNNLVGRTRTLNQRTTGVQQPPLENDPNNPTGTSTGEGENAVNRTR